jgi:hypothetical protein
MFLGKKGKGKWEWEEKQRKSASGKRTAGKGHA